MLVLISTFRIYRDRKAFSELAFQRVAAVNRFGYRFFDIASLSLDRAHENWCSQIEREGSYWRALLQARPSAALCRDEATGNAACER